MNFPIVSLRSQKCFIVKHNFYKPLYELQMMTIIKQH